MKVLISVILLWSLSGCAQVKQYLQTAEGALVKTSDENLGVAEKKLCEYQYAYQLRKRYRTPAERCAYDTVCNSELYGACIQSGTTESMLTVTSPAPQ